MKDFKDIEERVEATLNSIEGLVGAEANPFLLTRIEQRLRNEEQVNVYGKWMFRMAMTLILFIGLNVFSYSKFSNSTTATTTTGTGINAFANEYGLQQTADNI